jgi:hypothetical protein
MSHSYNKIWIYAIWATKERMPILHQNIEQKVYQFTPHSRLPVADRFATCAKRRAEVKMKDVHNKIDISTTLFMY